jgi:ribosomal protein S7
MKRITAATNFKNEFPIYKTNSMELKKKLANHIAKDGKKHQSEKAIHKCFKALQKSQKRNHGKIIKLSIINMIPAFKIIKLTNKKRRKKAIKEIPALVSSYKSRVSMGLKNLIRATADTKTKQTAFFRKFKNELLLGASSETNAITTKNNYQAKALNEKKYFRFYRW